MLLAGALGTVRALLALLVAVPEVPLCDPLLGTGKEDEEEDEDDEEDVEDEEADAVGDAEPPSASPSSSNILNMEENADFDAGALGRAAAAAAGLDAASIELDVADAPRRLLLSPSSPKPENMLENLNPDEDEDEDEGADDDDATECDKVADADAGDEAWATVEDWAAPLL